MKIVILGAGGWGALAGAYLAQAGAEVTLLFRRREHVDAIRQRGLVIEGACPMTVPVRATTSPQEIEEADLLIIAVKNQATGAALDGVRHMRIRAVASVQNGLGHAEQLRERFPEQEILRIVSRVSGSLIDYGRVNRGDTGFPTWIGDAYRGITPLVRELVDLFNQSGLPAFADQNIEAVEWCKLIWWVPTSLVAVLCRLNTTQFLQIPEMAYLTVRMAREEVTVARSVGVEVKDYDTIEIMGRVQGSLGESVQFVMDQGKIWEQHGGQGYRQGMLLDIERGRRTEMEQTGGYIIHLAEKNGIEVPYLDASCRVVRALERGWA